MRENLAQILDGLARYTELALRLPRELLKLLRKEPVPDTLIFRLQDRFMSVPTDKELQLFRSNFRLHEVFASHCSHRTNPAEVNGIIAFITGAETIVYAFDVNLRGPRRSF